GAGARRGGRAGRRRGLLPGQRGPHRGPRAAECDRVDESDIYPAGGAGCDGGWSGIVTLKTPETPEAPETVTLDVREIAPRDRHALIFRQFLDLAPDESMRLVHDDDPQLLPYQRIAEYPGHAGVANIESGPQGLQVR